MYSLLLRSDACDCSWNLLDVGYVPETVPGLAEANLPRRGTVTANREPPKRRVPARPKRKRPFSFRHSFLADAPEPGKMFTHATHHPPSRLSASSFYLLRAGTVFTPPAGTAISPNRSTNQTTQQIERVSHPISFGNPCCPYPDSWIRRFAGYYG